MLVENAALTLTSGQSADVEAALSRIAAYLESSSHCAGYLLTRDLAPQREPTFLLSAAWDTPRWCGLAWRYFADVFAAADVEVRVEVRATLTAAAQAPEAETAAARSHSYPLVTPGTADARCAACTTSPTRTVQRDSGLRRAGHDDGGLFGAGAVGGLFSAGRQ